MSVDFVLPPALEAHEPPEARGVARDGVRLLVSEGGLVRHHRFTELPDLLRAGDVLIVNTSATVPAAVPVLGQDLTVHFSTELDGGDWLVELRQDNGPFPGGPIVETYRLVGSARLTLHQPFSAGRLWEARLDRRDVLAYLQRFGEPIRYSYVASPWPISYYQTVFGTTPGSAEMPSASRPFTDRVVTRLVAAGVQFAPILLHTGVASAEAHERPYPERFAVPAATAATINAARADGRRVIAIGTTAVRAVESAVSPHGTVVAKAGWTELVITADRGVRVVDGLLSGLHEPRASHLDMLAAIAGRDLLDRTYAEAVEGRYLWHEFGDVNLLLP
jgi:S-adenosylmethionine:tRNA ribosyltransferase-isomerase